MAYILRFMVLFLAIVLLRFSAAIVSARIRLGFFFIMLEPSLIRRMAAGSLPEYTSRVSFTASAKFIALPSLVSG